jgi:alpha-D-ribose 1-methylphosphonate 5-triphosphate synthase subunit PhnH
MNSVVDQGVLPAWEDGAHDAQAGFRTVLKALAEPGSIQIVPVTLKAPQPLGAAVAALALTLADFETPVWLTPVANVPAVQSYLRFHCGCPLASDPAAAVFAIFAGRLDALALKDFSTGSMEYPDRSATLLIQVPSLNDGPTRVLSGPGIPGTRVLRVAGLPENFDAQWQQNAASFPLGVDLLFCCGNAIAGLPRTTRIHT